MNPLSYQVDALRALLAPREASVNGLAVDYGVTILITTALILLAARLYPRIVQ